MQKLSESERQQLLDIRREVETKWMDKYGRITVFNEASFSDPEDNRHDNSNPNIFTAYYWFIIYMLGELQERDHIKIMNAITVVETKRSDDSSIEGLYNRHPRTVNDVELDDVVSHDEYTGIVSMAYMVKAFHVVKGILNYGMKTGYTYNNHKPFVYDFDYTRQGSLIAYYQFMAGGMPALWNIIWFVVAAGISFCKPLFYTTGKLMTWMKLSLTKDKHILCKYTYQLMDFKFRSDYGDNYMTEIFRIYFHNKECPLHRLAALFDRKNK